MSELLKTIQGKCGPHIKELLLLEMENEYNNGNVLQSIYYQVRCLHQEAQERFYSKQHSPKSETTADELLSQMSNQENETMNR